MNFNFWQLLGGAGLFLFGMYLLEQSLNRIASRRFKQLLQRHTNKNGRAVMSGILTTAILQSSSIVSFMTLAFVGTGMIELQNALALILGANIGSTGYNWIVATLGFKLNLENIWFPVLGLAGIVLTIFGNQEKIRNICRFLIGFSFLFLALEFMKESMAGLTGQVHLENYKNYPPVVFVLIGFLITFLVQSSAATMAITLSAMHAGIIPFEMAAAIIVGSEPGTAIKLILGAAGGSSTKRRVALGNILFNLVTAIGALIFLHPLVNLVQKWIQDPLIGLVSFQTIMNILTLAVFFPILPLVSKWLNRLYRSTTSRSTLYIEDKIPGVTEFALDIFKLEIFYLLKRILLFNTREFKLEPSATGLDSLLSEKELKKENAYPNPKEQYNEIKHAEGELVEYFIRLEKESLNHEQSSTIQHQMNSMHSGMHSVKSFKDISHNNQELLKSVNDYKYNQFRVFQEMVLEIQRSLVKILEKKGTGSSFEELEILFQRIQSDYDHIILKIYQQSLQGGINDKDMATLLNMNREIYSGHKALIYAIAEFVLPAAEADAFKNIPQAVR